MLEQYVACEAGFCQRAKCKKKGRVQVYFLRAFEQTHWETSVPYRKQVCPVFVLTAEIKLTRRKYSWCGLWLSGPVSCRGGEANKGAGNILIFIVLALWTFIKIASIDFLFFRKRRVNRQLD